MHKDRGEVEYWNDESAERGKPWWIEDGKDPRLLDYLRRDTNLERCFRDGLDFIDGNLGGVRGSVLEPGAGVCWTSALLSLYPAVIKIEAVDCSRHRLNKIAPLVFLQYGASEDKIARVCGPIDEFNYSENSLDMVVFCQALYMFNDPASLLRKVRRILKPGGVVGVMCERIASKPAGLRAARQWLSDLLGRPPYRDPSGRRPYLDEQYRGFFPDAGLEVHVQALDYPVYPGLPVLAVNYFGVKR